ncbi:hypothetical protein A9Q74_01615 [Colwellia sp. 39_35_sub15_T18]|nr:hypothetical protein A9Q74_01615 [Colwellia sp. 39_35_sub15_T18]
MIDYQVVRSARRKTLSLQVKQGKVLVRAPYYVDKKIINALVQEKSAWLKAKVIEQSQLNQQCCGFNHGDKLLFLGQVVRLHISFASRAEIFLREYSSENLKLNSELKPALKSELKQELNIVLAKRYATKLDDEQLLRMAVKKRLQDYFKQQAQSIILSKVSHYSELTQLKPKGIKIRQYSARWGSCNSNGEVSFNYLMMMLPDDVIDYIVVHELCHLRFLNHSADFWQLVAIHFPNYLQAKQWLKDNQSQLLWRLP